MTKFEEVARIIHEAQEELHRDMAADLSRSLSDKDRQFIEESIAQGKAA